ncbi:MAG: molecular chaperone HtpG [Burkholderiales bacterium]|nr:molecular chaperone HtpG [Burkholderiales bacterium]
MGAQHETLAFQAEVKQLLNLMIHSLYSNKEIFLRELISNASDACDKLRFEALDNAALYGGDSELKIHVAFDKGARTITISDNGIGMSREEVIANLGTIAKSGTREFFSQLSGDKARDANLIGQFGVGFYSGFIVARKITVVTRRAGAEDAVRWESAGEGEFSIDAAERAGRGTDVILELREGEDDLLSTWRLKSIITKYSDHISLPILMKKEEWDKDKNEYVSKDEDERVNQATALWTRAKADITPEQYDEFYKHVSHDFAAPLAHTHNRVEGRQEYIQLLYLPAKAPFDLYDRERKHGIKLYVRRVFIMDDAEQLMPQYLRFVKGVIDSADLPLNVSREILQESRDVKAIREGSTKRVLSLLEELAGNEDQAQKDRYTGFWKEFGRVLKEGVGEDFGNKERIAKLLRFASTLADTDEESVALADYVARMKEGQDKIYYVTAETFLAAKNSPHLEVFRKKGIEVLLLSDRVDEWMVSHLTEFDGKQLVSVAKGDLDLGKLEDEAEKKEREAVEGESKELVEKITKSLGEKVKEVRITHRLTDSPACLVADENDMSANLARMLKAAGQKAPASKPILEINPKHQLITRLKYEEARFDDWSSLIFDQALLAEGGQLEDPAGFVKRMNEMLLAMTLAGK